MIFRKVCYLVFFIIMLVSLACAEDVTIFYDDFSDGDYTNNPAWVLSLGGFTNVINGELYADGIMSDGSGRYRTSLSSYLNFSAKNKLIMSFKGLLKSQENPKEG